MSNAAEQIRYELFAPDLPWNISKPEDLGPAIVRQVREQEPFFERWYQKWFENFAFVYGRHDVVWSRRFGVAIDRDMLKAEPSLAQRAQTNLARVILESLTSLIYAQVPTWAVEAMNQSSVLGKRFKRIVQSLLDAYMIRLCMDKEFSVAATTFAAFGQVAADINWHTNRGSVMSIPQFRKVRAPVFTDYMAGNPITGGLLEVPIQAPSSSGQPLFEERWEPILDELGRQVVKKVLAGDWGVEMLTPFQYARAIGSTGMHNTRYVRRFHLLDYDEAMERFRDLPGATRYFKRLRPLSASASIYEFAMRHYMRMAYTTPPSLDDFGRRVDKVLNTRDFRFKVFVIEHYDEPRLKDGWEKGRRTVVMNGDCTHITEPPYMINKRGGWHPFAEAQWLAIAPSSIASGPLNDVVAKNKELDTSDSLIATAMRRNMGSQLLVKAGSGFDPQRFDGEPGKYHIVSDPFNSFRWLHDDQPLPTVLPNLRQSLKDDVYETSGAGDAIRGERSPNVSTGYAQRQIDEREQRRLTHAKKQFGSFASTIGEKGFACLRVNVIQLGDDVMGFVMRSGAGELKPRDVMAMLKSEIDYGVDIKIEEDSMSAKSKASMQATLMELASGPAQQRITSSAKVLDEFLDYFEADILRDPSAGQRKRAQRENEVFTDLLRLGPDSEGGRPMVIFEDDDAIHLEEHTEWAIENSEELLKNEWLMLEWMTHQERHRLQMQEKAGQLMPGTSLATPQMMAQARGAQPPGVQTIYQDATMRAAQPSGGAPSQPPPGPEGGPPQKDPNAPSEQTAPARKPTQGGTPR